MSDYNPNIAQRTSICGVVRQGIKTGGSSNYAEASDKTPDATKV